MKVVEKGGSGFVLVFLFSMRKSAYVLTVSLS